MLALGLAAVLAMQAPLPLVPWPQKVTPGAGRFTVTPGPALVAPAYSTARRRFASCSARTARCRR